MNGSPQRGACIYGKSDMTQMQHMTSSHESRKHGGYICPNPAERGLASNIFECDTSGDLKYQFRGCRCSFKSGM